MPEEQRLDSWLAEHLVCPRHRAGLALVESALSCPSGCRYPIVDGVPVMLLDEVRQTMDLCQASLRLARQGRGGDTLFVESLGLSDREKAGILELARRGSTIDPVVAFLVGATNGNAYKHLIGGLGVYPIPELRLPPSGGEVLLDVGCNWGRWSVAAARKGYKVVGIDPSLGAVMAARRVASALGVRPVFVVGDARFLPLKAATIDRVFSYSVVQHFSREDAAATVGEIGRVLKPGGASFVQMPNRLGVRCLYHQARRRFREAARFEVRYWSLSELRKLFAGRVGETSLSVDCFFGLGLQPSDAEIMRTPLRAAVRVSEFLRRTSRRVPLLVSLADSVYVSSIKNG